ncbi:tetratricopeptide repeat protein [Ruania halotolerans]|uniref:tetratricopeptide repeat protein n=1 Tax=Ruania halotolerans TaxID=2897773 RepID=UPI001E629239|nr:tetratricopeptide repeat protein [Ruania halotolerans]UFU07680.1 tetratricopeptide repeat protein [Ruania halotolerans]
MSQPSNPVNLHGAVDLSAIAAPKPPAPSESTPAGLVVDVSEATFNDVIQQSMTVPVVVMLWQVGEGQSIALNPTMEALATEYGGKFVLARVDVAANPRIAQVFQAQTVPSVLAVLKGQPLPLFQGNYPAEQLRPVLDQVLQAAQENGVTGTMEVDENGAGEQQGAEPVEPPLPPHIQAAYDAIEADDLDGAAAAFQSALEENPRDEEAAAGLAQVELLRRIAGLDPAAVLAAADEAGAGDLAAQLPAADVEVASGKLADGYARLLGVIRVSAGDDRDAARTRLLELFQLAPHDAPEVVKARRDLAVALY